MRALPVIVISLVASCIAFDFVIYNKHNTEARSKKYDQPGTIIKRLEQTGSNTNTEEAHKLLADIYAKKFEAYTAKVSSLYSNITIYLVMCIMAIIVVARKDDIELPGFNTIRIPIQISYLVVPSTLCYYWIQFGFLLHDIIGLRLELITLIKVEYIDLFHNTANPSRLFADSYIYTPANTLKDTGFLDSWFLFFQPDFFPTSSVSSFARILPVCTMILVGLVYGIGQGFAIGLPYNWLLRYSGVKKIWIALCTFLFITIGILVLISHWTFYFGVENYNWLHIPILLAMIISFLIITAEDVRNHYLSVSDAVSTGIGFATHTQQETETPYPGSERNGDN
jgi:hypothetical protein